MSELFNQFALGTLPKNTYKYLKDKEPPVIDLAIGAKGGSKPAVRSVRQSRFRPEEKKVVDETPTTPRLIIFIAGGVTYSEIREVYDISNRTQREIVLCSSHTVTGEQFIAELSPSVADDSKELE